MSPAAALNRALRDRRVRRRGILFLACLAAGYAILLLAHRAHDGHAAQSIEATTEDWQQVNRSLP